MIYKSGLLLKYLLVHGQVQVRSTNFMSFPGSIQKISPLFSILGISNPQYNSDKPLLGT